MKQRGEMWNTHSPAMPRKNHRDDLRATCGKEGAAAVVLSHSARLNAKKFARVTDETHPAKLGRPAGNYNVSRHYDAGKRNRFSCDFRRDRIRSTSLRGNSLLRDRSGREILIGLLSCERVILGFTVSSVLREFFSAIVVERKKFIPMEFQSCRKIRCIRQSSLRSRISDKIFC